MTPTDFIRNTYAGASAMQQNYGIPALAAMAQSAQETGWGSTVVGNMYFGIKATSGWTGKTQLLWTHEVINGKSVKVQALFRAYDTAQESFEDYAKFIHGNPRYKNALQYTNDPEGYIQAVANAGYATDPNYADNIIAVINSIKKKLKK